MIQGSAKRRLMLVVGGALIGFWIVIALFAPLVAPYQPNDIDLDAYLAAPSAAHLLGTDEVGRDILSRVIFGARASLLTAFGVVAIGLVVGGVLGAFAGLIGGWVDLLAMRFVDLMLSMPSLVLALALTAALGPGIENAMLALGILSVPFYLRFVRSQTLLVREMEYVKWSEQAGASLWFRLRRHVAPNIAGPVVIIATLHCGAALLAGAALSFIGLGAQPPLAEWGALVSAGRHYILDQWWYSLFPGVAILSVSVGLNLLGDGLRDLLDPQGDVS